MSTVCSRWEISFLPEDLHLAGSEPKRGGADGVELALRPVLTPTEYGDMDVGCEGKLCPDILLPIEIDHDPITTVVGIAEGGDKHIDIFFVVGRGEAVIRRKERQSAVGFTGKFALLAGKGEQKLCVAGKKKTVFLIKEGQKVQRALEKGDTEGARYAVSMIVGRDTDVLDEDGIARAAVETVAENASDGVIAPMIWMILFGAVGGFFYKSINTMDSMLGYKNEKYLYFGRAAAKTDDVVNYIPARISGLLMVITAPIVGLDGRCAWKIFRRDRYKHASPNSAQTESACAGALGLRLAGDAIYGGVVHKKEYIGDPVKSIEPKDITRAGRLMYAASVMMLVIGVILRSVVILCL